MIQYTLCRKVSGKDQINVGFIMPTYAYMIDALL